jgi:hypothetical protein
MEAGAQEKGYTSRSPERRRLGSGAELRKSLFPPGLRTRKNLLSAALSVFSRLIGINRAQAL